MKRAISHDEFNHHPGDRYTLRSRIQTLVEERETQILQIKEEYFQTLGDLETFYADQSQQLCSWLWSHTQNRIEIVNKMVEESIKNENMHGDTKHQQKKVCL